MSLGICAPESWGDWGSDSSRDDRLLASLVCPRDMTSMMTTFHFEVAIFHMNCFAVRHKLRWSPNLVFGASSRDSSGFGPLLGGFIISINFAIHGVAGVPLTFPWNWSDNEDYDLMLEDSPLLGRHWTTVSKISNKISLLMASLPDRAKWRVESSTSRISRFFPKKIYCLTDDCWS